MWLILLLILVVMIIVVIFFKKRFGGGIFEKYDTEIYELKGNYPSMDEKIKIIKNELIKKDLNNYIKILDEFVDGKEFTAPFINTLIRMHNNFYKTRTNFNDKKIKLRNPEVPKFDIYTFDLDVEKAKKSLEILYANEKINYAKIGKNSEAFFIKWHEDRSVTTLAVYSYAKKFLSEYSENDYLAKVCDQVLEKTYKLTGYKNGLMSIVKYNSAVGLGQHIDKMALHLDGPIVTVNVGEDFFYDIFPIFEKKKLTPKRIKIPKGGMFIMEGKLRNRWSHGICENDVNTIGKYSLVFKMSSKTEEELEKRALSVIVDSF